MTAANLPLPPASLAQRVGGTEGDAFEQQGQGIKELIVRCLPEGYDFSGRRVLDFGCGSGRVLRHFAAEAARGEFWGCDIDAPSIRWLAEKFPKQYRFFQNRETPPLAVAADSFDLVYVVSVFTHLTESQWRPWLQELKRVLKPGGTAVLTFHNRVAYEYNTGRRFDEENTGLLVLHPTQSWRQGGPMVYHSNWWIQQHWGAELALEYISREALFGWQSVALLTKRDPVGPGCPILQPHPYQVHNPDFRGNLDAAARRSPCLRHWHGLELAADERGSGTLAGWFASKAGAITRIEICRDQFPALTLPGPDQRRPDVQQAHPDWPGSLRSGFAAALPLGNVSPGEHDCTITATDVAGNQLVLQTLVIVPARPGPAPAVPEVAEILCAGQPSAVVPPVTVVISLYNYRDHIAGALESLKRQTLADLDLIVVDDCSNDGSAAVACEWLGQNGGRFHHYQLLRHRANQGLARARNLGFAVARTEYVFVLDADNEIYPRCLERLLGALRQGAASFAHCLFEKFGDAAGVVNTKPWNPASFQQNNTIDAMVLMRKRVWEEVGGYSTDMPVMGWEDFDLWFKIARARGWGVQVPEILARYRFHHGSMLNATTNPRTPELWSYLRAKYPEFFGKNVAL